MQCSIERRSTKARGTVQRSQRYRESRARESGAGETRAPLAYARDRPRPAATFAHTNTLLPPSTSTSLNPSTQGLYLLLVTNRGSNILEDIDTLRLLSKLVPEYAGVAVDEEAVAQVAFDLIFAFDEVIALGHKENITVQQVKQNCEMESHEEKLHKMIIQSKIQDTKDIMKRKALEIDKHKLLDSRRPGVGGVGMGMGGGGGGGGEGGCEGAECHELGNAAALARLEGAAARSAALCGLAAACAAEGRLDEAEAMLLAGRSRRLDGDDRGGTGDDDDDDGAADSADARLLLLVYCALRRGDPDRALALLRAGQRC